MSDYSRVHNFTAKDALSTGDPAKLIKGTEVDAELDAIATAIATKANDSAVVHNTGNETVAGNKTFSGTSTFSAASTFSATLTMSGAAINHAARVNVASAATCNIGAAASNNVQITGTTTITAFDNVAEGITRHIVFADALILTHSANLLLPGAANITTAGNDHCEAVSRGGGAWSVRFYQKANGLAPVSERGLVWLGTQTASASASLPFTSGISSTYRGYVLKTYYLRPASAGAFRLQVSEDGGSTWKTTAGDYIQTAQWRNSAGTATDNSATGESGILIADTTNGVSTDSAHGVTGTINFYLPSGTTHRKYFDVNTHYLQATTSEHASFICNGRYTATSNAINAIRIISGAGNITSGFVELYGIKNS